MKNVLSIIAAVALIATFTASFALARDLSVVNVNNNVNRNVTVNNSISNSNNQNQSRSQSQKQSMMINEISPEVISVLQKIAGVQKELAENFKFCYRNMELRHELVTLNIAAFDQTGHESFLETANINAVFAEKNYTNGEDIKQHQATAKQMLTQVNRLRAFYIWKTEGNAQAKKFADANGVKAY